MSVTFAAEGFWKAFRGRPVLRNASVWGEPGAVTVLFGRNGSGKTTLFRVALGFVRGDAGVVIVGGARRRRPTLAELARAGVFFLPETSLFADTFTLRAHFEAVRRRVPAANVAAATGALGVAAFLDRRAIALSGGERRRAEIALALAREPAVLIADEPFRGLAPRDAERVAAGLRLLADRGCAIIASGHETRALLELADGVVWMTNGTTHALGSSAEARIHDQFRREYLVGRAS